MSAIQNVQARAEAIAAAAGPAETVATAEAPTTADEPTTAAAETPATEITTETSAPDPEAEIRTARHKILEEKLAAQREARQAARLAERALAERKAAEADRQAAAQERAAIQEGRKDFRKFFQANGMNPREAYEEMTRQAIEADTPEAKIKAMQAAWKAELEAQVAPLKQEVEQLRAERARLAQEAREAAISRAFTSEIEQPEYQSLRIEYDDQDIFGHVQRFAESPESFYPIAKKYEVALQEPQGRFTMREVLQVLKAAQDAHEAGKEPRRARLVPDHKSPADSQSAQPAPTVNGTAARSNAETITNDLASTRASSGQPTTTRKERMEAIIRRLERR